MNVWYVYNMDDVLNDDEIIYEIIVCDMDICELS